jgi:hypothetical protein
MAFTPFFPQWRAQLAALRRRTARSVRQLDLLALSENFRDLFPRPCWLPRRRAPAAVTAFIPCA